MTRSLRTQPLDWAAARSIPITTAASKLNVALALKRQQRCPFEDHSDDTPSFSLDTRKNLFHCFGCGRGGSVIEFVAEMRRCTKREACAWLLGLATPTDYVRPRKAWRTAAAAPTGNLPDPEVYASLLAISPLRDTGLAYLARRCISSRTADVFRVGQIGNPADTVRRLGDQFGIQRVAASGLVTSALRLWFPEDALLFGHFKEEQPYYLQSRRIAPGDPRWMGLAGITKIPFNADAARTASEIYLVEGAIDVLSAHELQRSAIGLPGASSSLPDELCSILRGRTVYIIPDKDDAGARFAVRMRNELLAKGIQTTIQTLTTGKDLNDYLIAVRRADA